MREEVLFSVDTPYRENLEVKGWKFGNSEHKSIAIMGALRGNEVQQMFVCSLLIQELERLEMADEIKADAGILVVPCANQFSMNVGRRFWAADNTDINRMFPGYDQGETTQRIADRVFKALQGYAYGVHLTSFYQPGAFLPHVRMMETGYQNPEDGLDFGLSYVVVRKPQPYDTTTLNYNWQIWDTKAFSLYTKEIDVVDEEAAHQAVDAMLRFMHAKGIIKEVEVAKGDTPLIFFENTLESVLSKEGGLLLHRCEPGVAVRKGEPLGDILDPCTSVVREQLVSPCDGNVFFAHKNHLINGHDVAFRILPDKK